jgi:hypothetical protein
MYLFNKINKNLICTFVLIGTSWCAENPNRQSAWPFLDAKPGDQDSLGWPITQPGTRVLLPSLLQVAPIFDMQQYVFWQTVFQQGANNPELSQLLQPQPSQSRKVQYGTGIEACKMRERTADFDWVNCRAFQLVKEHYERITFSELKSVVISCIAYNNGRGVHLPPLNRNEKRNYKLLLKYIDNHYDVCETFLTTVLVDTASKRSTS